TKASRSASSNCWQRCARFSTGRRPFWGATRWDRTNGDGTDPVYHHIFAVPEKAALEIRVPVVDSYTYDVQGCGITCDVESLDGFVVQDEPTKVYPGATVSSARRRISRADRRGAYPLLRSRLHPAIPSSPWTAAPRIEPLTCPVALCPAAATAPLAWGGHAALGLDTRRVPHRH